MKGRATILRADASSLPLADDSVDLIVTSPPYFALRSYQDQGQHYDGQLGSEPTPDAFVSSLLAVTRECVRVLKPTGSLWVNLGDKYAGSNGQPGGRGSSTLVGTTSHTRGMTRNRAPGGAPTKSLIGIPWRYALRCIDELGLILRAEVIWAKPNGLPESVTDRVRRSHEQWFHFTLQPRYYSAVDEVRESHQDLSWLGRGQQERTNAARNDGGKVATTANTLGRVPGSVWTIPSQPLRVPTTLNVDHFAAFPMEWPRRIIQGWSPREVCTACGEGRRPVVDKQLEVRSSATGRQKSRELGRETPGGQGGWDSAGYPLGAQSVTIVGYACACTPYHDEAGTPVERSDDRATGLPPRTTRGSLGNAPTTGARRVYHFEDWTPPETTQAVVLDPFGGTGTTAVVAKALGRHGISVDLSSDYCRLATWRCSDEGELASAMQVPKPAKQIEGQVDLLSLVDADTWEG